MCLQLLPKGGEGWNGSDAAPCPRCSDRKGTVTKSWSLHWRDNKRHGGRRAEVATTFHIGCPTNALSEIWRRWAIETSECQNDVVQLQPKYDNSQRVLKFHSYRRNTGNVDSESIKAFIAFGHKSTWWRWDVLLGYLLTSVNTCISVTSRGSVANVTDLANPCMSCHADESLTAPGGTSSKSLTCTEKCQFIRLHVPVGYSNNELHDVKVQNICVQITAISYHHFFTFMSDIFVISLSWGCD